MFDIDDRVRYTCLDGATQHYGVIIDISNGAILIKFDNDNGEARCCNLKRIELMDQPLPLPG